MIADKSVREWIATGADLEDVPAFRALNHFHNPLEPWPQAGLRVLGFQLGQSSAYWQQNPNQGGPEETWSWRVARDRFFDFLTLPSKDARGAALAKSARALGQVMHLIQDATSPAHTQRCGGGGEAHGANPIGKL